MSGLDLTSMLTGALVALCIPLVLIAVVGVLGSRCSSRNPNPRPKGPPPESQIRP